ncbi:MAG: hAT transposon family protein, partial [Nitrososphaerales archaeon]
KNASALHPPSLISLLNTFPYLLNVVDCQELDNEWRMQSLLSSSAADSSLTTGDPSVEHFWKERLSQRSEDNVLLYPNLLKVVSILFSLPASNASVERVFSVLKNVKTCKRYNLKRQSLVSLLHTKGV